MATIQRFEELKIWLKARTIAQKVYVLTNEFPLRDDRRLKEQMRGSAGSIMDNIAEGFERGSRLEFLHALAIAKGETGELKSQCYRALDANYFDTATFEDLYGDADEETKMLTSYIKYLNKSKYKGQQFKDRQDL